MEKAISYIVFGMALLIAACKKDPVVVAVTGSTKDLRIPANFEFKTTADIGLNVFVKSSTTVLSGVPVSVYLDNPGYSEAPNSDARIFGAYSSDDSGWIKAPIRLPARQDTVYLQTGYFGLESLIAVPVIGGSVNYTYGQGGNSLPELVSGNYSFPMFLLLEVGED